LMNKLFFGIMFFLFLLIPFGAARADTKVIQSVDGSCTTSVAYSTYTCDKAFNDDTADYWHAGFMAAWIEYDFGSGVTKEVSGYEFSLMDQAHSGTLLGAAKNWTFEYYDTGSSEWVVIDTQTDQTGWSYAVLRSYDFSPVTAQRFRLNVTATNNDNLSIGVLHFYDTVAGPTDTPTPTATATPTATTGPTSTDTPTPMATGTPYPLTLPANMAPPSIDVDQGTLYLVSSVIDSDKPSDSEYYAITSITNESYFRFVSIVGITGTVSNTWNLDEGGVNYIGLVLLDYTGTPTGTIEGSDGFTTMIYDTLIPHTAKEQILAAASADGAIFPWQNGMKMWLGPRGTHACGFGLNSWSANDWVSDGNTSEGRAPDVVYTSQAGAISYICKGDINEAVRIGNFVYEHLRPGNYQIGDQYAQGEPLGNLVHGSFSESCGWAQQSDANFHVHWCSPTGDWTNIEGWSYNYDTACWSRGEESVCIGDYMTASGGSNGGNPDPGGGSDGGGGNLWTLILNGVTKLVAWLVYKFPDHNEIGITQMVVDTTSTGIAVLFIVIFTQIDPTWPLILLTVWSISEGSRGIYAVWRLILKVIPFLN
jgi:hypothetical protein